MLACLKVIVCVTCVSGVALLISVTMNANESIVVSFLICCIVKKVKRVTNLLKLTI